MAYIYEFLYRGRPNGDSAYHVVLGDVVLNFGREQHVESSVLTPEQADKLGFPLEAIIAEINTAVMIARDQAVLEKAVVEAERDAAIAQRDQALVEKTIAEAERDAALAKPASGAPRR